MSKKVKKRPLSSSFKKSDSLAKKRKLSPKEYAEQRYKAKHPFKTTVVKKQPLVLKKQDAGVRKNPRNVKRDDETEHKGPLTKKERRDRKREQKKKRPNGEIRTQLNMMVGQKRLKDQKRKVQIEEVKEILDTVRGKALELVKSREPAKALQRVIKYGAPEHLLEIAKELKGHYRELVCDTYARFTVQRLLEYGKEDVKSMIVGELMKDIARLITHRLASTIVDYAIMTTDEVTRRKAIQFIVSRKFMIFESNESKTETEVETEAKKKKQQEKEKEKKKDKVNPSIDDFLNEDADENSPADAVGEIKVLPQSVDSILVNSDTVERKHIMKNMYKFIMTGVEKDMMSTGVFQTILYQYLNYCTRHELETIMELCIIPNAMQLQNVKEGTFAIMNALCQCYYKTILRKQLLKSIHHFVIPMCCDKDSHLVIIRLLEVFDDTKQLHLMIIKKIIAHLDILCFHDFGRLVLLHLLCPRDEKYFKDFDAICPKPLTEKEFQNKHQNEDGINLQDPTTWIKIKISERPSCKKDEIVRRKELMQSFVPGIVDYCCRNIKKLLIHSLGGTIVIETLRLLLRGTDVLPKNANDLAEKLTTSLLRVTLSDKNPKEQSPIPPLPEKPAILQKAKSNHDGEINDVVRTSLSNLKNNKSSQKATTETNEENQPPQDEKNETTDENGDAQVATTKKAQATEEEDIANAQHQTEMLKYNVDMHRHKTLDYTYDTSTPVMLHGLGRRRLVKAMEMLEELHKEVCDYVCKMEQKDLKSLIETPGVYVFCVLFQHCKVDDIKSRLRTKLGPILQSIAKDYTKKDLEKQKGLNSLINYVLH